VKEKVSPVRMFETWLAFQRKEQQLTLDISLRANGWHYTLDARLANGRASARFIPTTSIQELFRAIVQDIGWGGAAMTEPARRAQAGDPSGEAVGG